MRSLRKREGDEATLGVAMDLPNGLFGIRQIGDTAGYEPLRIRGVPLLVEPIVPGTHAGNTHLAVARRREDTPAEAGDR